VVQTSPHMNTYSGSAQSKNFDGDVALVQSVAEEYAATQLRQDTLTATTKPGVITTKKARADIEERIEGDVAAVDHYGNVTGSNALGELNLGVVLGCRHFGDAVVEKWAALAGETVHRSGHGSDLDYRSETANTFLQHMREDQTLQAILRFGRDKEGAVVFAHTAALAESLPVVGEGAVVRAFSKATKAVTRAARMYRGQEFTVGDVADAVECSRRTVRRVLNEQTELGYLEKHETKNGLANGYRAIDEPAASEGEVEFPSLGDPFDTGMDPAEFPPRVSSTGFVWVVGVNRGNESRHRDARPTLPAPAPTNRGDPPPTTAD
jgi:AraC-like DNA-binding protein